MPVSVYSELADFLVAHISAHKIIAFRPSEAAQRRLDKLSSAVKSGAATREERAEVEQCLQLEHLMQLVKARARCKMASQDSAIDSR